MLNLAICKYLVLAQISSDAGKGIYDIADIIPIGNVYAKKEYRAKDALILKAIKLISSSNKTGFHFSVKHCYEYSSNAFLVYFNFKLNGKRMQISFHSFSNRLERWISKQSQSTRWDKKSSRNSAIALAEYLNENNKK